MSFTILVLKIKMLFGTACVVKYNTKRPVQLYSIYLPVCQYRHSHLDIIANRSIYLPAFTFLG